MATATATYLQEQGMVPSIENSGEMANGLPGADAFLNCRRWDNIWSDRKLKRCSQQGRMVQQSLRGTSLGKQTGFFYCTMKMASD